MQKWNQKLWLYLLNQQTWVQGNGGPCLPSTSLISFLELQFFITTSTNWKLSDASLHMQNESKLMVIIMYKSCFSLNAMRDYQPA